MKRQPLKRKSRLSPVSAKRSAAMKEYAASRKAFLGLRPLCEVWRDLSGSFNPEHILLCRKIFGGSFLDPVYSTDVHHVRGRSGANYLDTATWMAVSRKGHAWIHANPKKAREMGWLA